MNMRLLMKPFYIYMYFVTAGILLAKLQLYRTSSQATKTQFNFHLVCSFKLLWSQTSFVFGNRALLYNGYSS